MASLSLQTHPATLQAAAGGTTLGAPITELALLNTFTLLLWQLKALQQQPSSSTAPSSSSQSADSLGERVQTFCIHLEGIYDVNEGLQRVRDCVFRIQADLFLLFSSNKLEVGCAVTCCDFGKTNYTCEHVYYLDLTVTLGGHTA